VRGGGGGGGGGAPGRGPANPGGRGAQDTGVTNQAGVVLIFRPPLSAASRGCLPASTFNGRRVPGELRDVAAIASLEKNMVHSVWFPAQASRPWKLLQLEAEATRARQRTAREIR
jgi:hypothetical protein